MSHHNKAPSFGRTTDQKRMLMRSLLKSLIVHERISTTEAKAKALRPVIEKMVTRARVDSVANRRLIAARLGNDQTAVRKLFTTIAPRYKDRKGGYTRIIKRAVKATTGRKEAYIAFVD